jgi:hypothetical protein
MAILDYLKNARKTFSFKGLSNLRAKRRAFACNVEIHLVFSRKDFQFWEPCLA